MRVRGSLIILIEAYQSSYKIFLYVYLQQITSERMIIVSGMMYIKTVQKVYYIQNCFIHRKTQYNMSLSSENITTSISPIQLSFSGPKSRIIIFGVLIALLIPSVLCSIYLFYQFIRRSEIRQRETNLIIICLFIVNFIQVCLCLLKNHKQKETKILKCKFVF